MGDNDENPRIAQNPSFVELQHDIERAQQLIGARPLLGLLGVRLDDRLVGKIAELDQSLQELSTLPDRFNDLFGQRGWIAYELLNLDAMRQAVQLGEAGDLDAAEQSLVEHFCEKTIVTGLTFMAGLETFRCRERLARLALEDYLQGRYHACVPVLLMIIDGFANDVSRSKGFFAEGSDFIAWDSISAHNRGLKTLTKLWNQYRTKTTTEAIHMPFRNGILHGRDLGYDNRLVAAKLWAALFALREWALAVRDNRLDEPPPKPQPSLEETLAKHRRLQEQRILLENWKPRTEQQMAAIPRSGEPSTYEQGSPERAVAELMYAWSKKNYGNMAILVHYPAEGSLDRGRMGQLAGEVREHFQQKSLKSFRFNQICDLAPAITTAKLLVEYEENGESMERHWELRFNYFDENGLASRERPGGRWAILNWAAL